MSRSGGTERVAANLCRNFAKQGVEEITLVAIEPCSHSFYQVPPNVQLISLNIPRPQNAMQWLTWYPQVVYKLRKRLKEYKLNFVLGFASNPSCCAIIACLGLAVKVIAFEHMHYRYYWDHVTGARRFVFFLRRIIYPLADAVVALTDKDQAEFAKFCKHTIAIPNVISSLVYQDVKIDYSRKRILAVGRISKQKGFDLLIKAWAGICRYYPEWELNIVGGKFAEERNFIKQFENMPEWQEVQDSVKIIPPSANIMDYYQNASIFIMSSRWEGFPMVLLEAMGCGLSTVSFNCPNGPGEIIEDEVNGLLVQDGNILELSTKLRRLMDDEELRCKLGRTAQEVRVKYGWRAIGSFWAELFYKLNYEGEPK
jgi:glycosyltransferase involved in cell wall biosynthesis